MFPILREIILEINRSKDFQQVLSIIVTRVRENLGVDACSILLKDQQSEELVLMATDGLRPESVGKVIIAPGEGLAGVIAQRAEPLNLSGARQHPNFLYFPETGEAPFDAYLGVPIIHHRKLLGVLSLQQKSGRFNEDIETFLITIAAQLSGVIAHAESTGGITAPEWRAKQKIQTLKGIAGADGIAIGTAVVIHQDQYQLEDIEDREHSDQEAELTRFRIAVSAVKRDFVSMMDNLREEIDEDERALFDAYLLLLEGRSFSRAIEDRIMDGIWAPSAIRDVVMAHMQAFANMDDPYIKERANDIKDLGQRVFMRLQQGGESEDSAIPDSAILVAKEVTAAMIAEFPLHQLKGVVSMRGSSTSHTAILSRALNIPAVLGMHDLPIRQLKGIDMVVDGYAGEIHLNPSSDMVADYNLRHQRDVEVHLQLDTIRDEPCITNDGTRIHLYANTGLLADITPAINSGAEGVGLYRTEYPFMLRDRFPGEDEQVRLYRKVMESFAPNQVTMRTLDIGGDKALPYFPMVEDNPFLGWRGIRFTLDHPEIFLVQIRAMIRASAGLDNLRILLPMISHLSELDESIVLIHQAVNELQQEYDGIVLPQIGAMIEVPSALFQLDEIAKRCDFLSVGTNDLTQYLLAVDRNNPQVASLYNSLHPSVLEALRMIAEVKNRLGIDVSICGEMAGDPLSAMLLVGMGFDSLSTNSSSIPRLKWVLRQISKGEAEYHASCGVEQQCDFRQLRAYIDRLLLPNPLIQ